MSEHLMFWQLVCNYCLDDDRTSRFCLLLSNAFFSGDAWKYRSHTFSSQTLFISVFYIETPYEYDNLKQLWPWDWALWVWPIYNISGYIG